MANTDSLGDGFTSRNFISSDFVLGEVCAVLSAF
jgi:hypothetical protein